MANHAPYPTKPETTATENRRMYIDCVVGALVTVAGLPDECRIPEACLELKDREQEESTIALVCDGARRAVLIVRTAARRIGCAIVSVVIV